MKNQFTIEYLSCPQEISDAVSKSYVDGGLKDPSIKRNTALVDFNDKNLDNVRFVKVKSLPAVREHLAPKFYVDEGISQYVDESSLLKLDPGQKLNLDEQDSIILYSTLISPRTIIEIPTKSYVENTKTVEIDEIFCQ